MLLYLELRIGNFHKIREKEGGTVNAKELKAQMIRKDKTVDHLCEVLQIGRSAWFRKVSGMSEFKQSEIAKLRVELDLDDSLTRIIFFDQKVS